MCPHRLQETCASQWGRAGLLGGLPGLGTQVILSPVPGASPTSAVWAAGDLAAAGDLGGFPLWSQRCVQCNVQRCPNPVNSPLCFPHLKSLIGSSSRGRGCGAAARLRLSQRRLFR